MKDDMTKNLAVKHDQVKEKWRRPCGQLVHTDNLG